MFTRRDFFKRLSAVAFIPFISPHLAGRKSHFLFDAYVAGFSYYDGEKVARSLKKGDLLVMKREPNNRYDELAIDIYTRREIKLGYVPRHVNSTPPFLLDQDMMLEARIIEVNLPPLPPWERVRFAVFHLT